MATPVRYKDIKSADQAKYDVMSMGETMLRINPGLDRTTEARSATFSQGGGETNVAYGAAHCFRLRAAVLTAFVDDEVGRNIEQQMNTGRVDTDHIIWWNTKNNGTPYSTDAKGTIANGINFTYNGKGVVPSATTYYRGNTAARQLKPGDFDFSQLFGELGARVFNTGGIFTLIGPNTADLAIEAAQAAAEYGTFVSADLNYRSKVEPDKNRAAEINAKLAPYLSMLVGNHSDFADALGFETDVKKGASFVEWLDAYKGTVTKVAEAFPNLSLIGTQWRDPKSADMVSWGAALYDVDNDTWYTAPVREDVTIIDRTGGGDSFASGTLAALLKGQDLETAVNWGAAHGILVQEGLGDVSKASQAMVEKEVKRALSAGGVLAVR